MNKFLLAFSLLGLTNYAYTQHIPDANFANAIRQQCPTCIDANDDLLPAAANLDTLLVSNANISDLTGIGGFTNLLCLNCGNNNLANLPTLPITLQDLEISGNQFSTLPTIPIGLINLSCGFNQLTTLPTLSSYPLMQGLACNNNQLNSLPALPPQLIWLYCFNNQLDTLPALPPQLIGLDCSNNQLSSLVPLPNTLELLLCSDNMITHLPALPNNRLNINCSNNLITSLPNFLPNNLEGLLINNNPINTLPTLPNFLHFLGVANTTILCLPTLPPDLSYLNIDSTSIQCLPNIPFLLQDSGFTVCDTSSNCFIYPQIQGRIYIDTDVNGIFNGSDIVLPWQAIEGTNSSYNYFGISDTEGNYVFSVDTNSTITLSLNYDTTYFLINPASYSINATNASGQMFIGYDFGIIPIPINDLEIILTTYIPPRPGFDHTFVLTYRNVGNTTLSGTVDLNLDNVYQNLAFSQTPSAQTGNSVTWTFSGLQPFESRDFYITVNVPSTTSLGTILINNALGTITNDADTTNNLDIENCTVVGSYDPNDKTADVETITPDAVTAGNQALTYTIRFQNTGTYPATFVEVRDTLDATLDASTLRFLSESHSPVQISVENDMQNPQHPTIIKWFFNNINLADSFSNEPASHGFVKFSVKPKTNLVLGNQIPNTASIYFDYNAPVVTNTEIVVVDYVSSVPKTTADIAWKVFPNPTESILNIEVATFDNTTTVLIINSLGQIVQQQKIQNYTQQLHLQALPQGLYQVTLYSKQGVASRWIRKN